MSSQDPAVEQLIQRFAVNRDTFEVHLSLGELFCRQGEVEKAIRIHQNLVNYPELSARQKAAAWLALARDYLAAGLLDRAEGLFKELFAAGVEPAVSLRHLLEIYEQEKDWVRAIEVACQLQVLTQEPVATQIAHYYCELAHSARQQDNFEQVQCYLYRALEHAPQAARPRLQLAEVKLQQGQATEGLSLLTSEEVLHSDDLSEAIGLIEQCFQSLQQEDSYHAFLEVLVQKEPAHGQIVLAYAKSIARRVSVTHALDYLLPKMCQGGWLYLEKILEWVNPEQITSNQFKQQLILWTADGLEKSPKYRCQECGFAGSAFHWQCPTCKTWGQIKLTFGFG